MAAKCPRDAAPGDRVRIRYALHMGGFGESWGAVSEILRQMPYPVLVRCDNGILLPTRYEEIAEVLGAENFA